MKHFKTTLLISVLLVLLFAIVLVCMFLHAINQLDSKLQDKTYCVRVGYDSNSFYLRTKVYGIAGNHEQIILSKSENRVPNHKEDYFFYTTKIFYKVENNILCIYAPESSVSEPIKKSPNVIIIKLKTHDEIRNYSNHYLSYGLEQISVYK